MDYALLEVFTAKSLLAKVVLVKFAARPRLNIVLCEKPKQAVKLSVQQDGPRPSTGISEIRHTEI
jgi:hypothetical protein